MTKRVSKAVPKSEKASPKAGSTSVKSESAPVKAEVASSKTEVETLKSSAEAPQAAVDSPKEKVETPPASARRVLDVFLVDSGWNTAVGAAVRENLPNFASYLQGQRFYVLSKAQSVEFINRHTALVGADPILIVLDRQAAKQQSSKGFGFRLCLGHMQNPEAAISMLKWAIQLSMASNGGEMAKMVRESGHRQTVQGTIELIGESSAHLLEFAPV